MPKYIVKLTDGNESWYLEWSTIVDAPTTNGMTLEEFKAYYLVKYGTEGSLELPARLARVEKFGTSDYEGMSADDVIAMNRAGPREGTLSKRSIIKRFCKSRAA